MLMMQGVDGWRFNSQTIAILNILSLLRIKPMSFNELWNSGAFRFRDGLLSAIQTLLNANCIEKYGTKSKHIYVVLGYGLSLLSLYPSWQLLPDTILDVVVPIKVR